MATPPAVLDASALVALVRQEKGHEVVLRLVRAGAVTTPANLAEALTILRQRGYRGSVDDIVDDLGALGLEVEPMLMEDGVEMARMLEAARAATAKQPNIGGLSLGDAACLAVAKRLGVPAVASDGTWEVLDLGVRVLPFR